MDRFTSKIKVSDSGCHEWQSTISRSGYGKFWFESRQIPAHRMAYELFIGPIPDGMCVCHRCDNRKCVNPEHLFLGTYQDNVRDMHRKGRAWGRRKLEDKDVFQILNLIETGELSQTEIGLRFGVSQITVSRLKLRQREYLNFINIEN